MKLQLALLHKVREWKSVNRLLGFNEGILSITPNSQRRYKKRVSQVILCNIFLSFWTNKWDMKFYARKDTIISSNIWSLIFYDRQFEFRDEVERSVHIKINTKKCLLCINHAYCIAKVILFIDQKKWKYLNGIYIYSANFWPKYSSIGIIP